MSTSTFTAWLSDLDLDRSAGTEPLDLADFAPAKVAPGALPLDLTHVGYDLCRAGGSDVLDHDEGELFESLSIAGRLAA